MNSQVKSQISDKVYESTLDDLSELDQGIEVDLYKLNVFNKDIMIAPGKVMSDAKKDVHYCYVYVIKNGKVAAKLGIYETHVKRGEVYDLTDFEGREFLLFDHYYNEPGSLVAFEMKEEVQVDNIFDYLKRFLKPVTNATAAIKEQAAVIRKISKRIDGKPQASLLKNFKRQKPYDEAWLDSFKEDAENWMFNLLVLETVFRIKFIFENSDESEDEMREMLGTSANESTTVIRVSLEDIPRHLANNAPKATAPVEEEEEEEEEEFVKDTFPSPTERTESPIPGPIEELPIPEPSEEKPVKSFSSKLSPESKSVKSFSSKLSPESKPVKSFSSKPSPEAKSVKSFSSKQSPEAKSSSASKPPPEEKPVKSFSSKASEAKSSSASKPPPESSASKPSPIAESKSTSKASASKPPEAKSVRSFSSKPSPEASASKQSPEPSETVPEPRTESPPRPSPSVRKSVSPSPAEGPPKPKRISFSAPVKKLKNSAP